MAKILVFQHAAYEPLGTLDPLIRRRGHRIRYANFAREPELRLKSADGYQALVVLGGPMNVDEEARWPHLNYEREVIAQFLRSGRPVLGICLGCQLLASALGAAVYPASVTEIGWYPVEREPEAAADPLAQHFAATEQVLQWHGRTFDLPVGAQLLLGGDDCPVQAFRHGSGWGLQFHLECDAAQIGRWLKQPALQADLDAMGEGVRERIREQTVACLPAAMQLGHEVFSSFLDQLPDVARRPSLRSR